MSHVSARRAHPGGSLRLAAAVALAVTTVDLASKIAATTLLQGSELSLRGGIFLTVVYNDSFARGMDLGALTLPATIVVAMLVLGLAVWIGSALTRIDGDAPLALGLIAGATIANATDYVRTGRGVVDFLGFETGADSAVVFNLADVAAYVGVLLLARTSLQLCMAIAAERRTVRLYRELRVAADRTFERAIPLSVVVDGAVVRHADRATADREPILDVPADSAARTARGIDSSTPTTEIELRADR